MACPLKIITKEVALLPQEVDIPPFSPSPCSTWTVTMGCTPGHVLLCWPSMSTHRERPSQGNVCWRFVDTKWCPWMPLDFLLQLGAGTAVPGIVAAKCGAKVTLTDTSVSPVLLENLRKTCELNGVPDVTVMGLQWGVISPSLLALEPQDLILASDCFYDSQGIHECTGCVYIVCVLVWQY